MHCLAIETPKPQPKTFQMLHPRAAAASSLCERTGSYRGSLGQWVAFGSLDRTPKGSGWQYAT
eukprot:CAMPEP_0183520640 /NCGR_PEP_ID=MMETSP0371-20130417/17079_1 /TAXON_ID=268820 /ORGANISM="Peridinium aciculiferum, Strain PAER-2" /LENGTH=62 /DNA_ID=CAMNT_0025719045 /DNA_START=36 /DNA_END=221 /DNA_ORIENTATION=-